MDSLFDGFGRLIPKENERVYATIDRGYFSLEQSEIDLGEVYQRLCRFMKSSRITLQLQDFEQQTSLILQRISLDPIVKNLLNAVRIPFIIPKLESSLIENSTLQKWLSELNSSFCEMFPSYEFRNLLSEESLNLKILEVTRYQNLIRKALVGDVVGWYFPNVMSGFAVPDQRELMSRLPDDFILSGPLESTVSLIGTPSIFMKSDGKYPNLLCLSAVEPENAEEKHFFYFYEAYGWNLYFNKRSMIGAVSEYYAGGITITA